jgi:hypothetical protein
MTLRQIDHEQLFDLALAFPAPIPERMTNLEHHSDLGSRQVFEF